MIGYCHVTRTKQKDTTLFNRSVLVIYMIDCPFLGGSSNLHVAISQYEAHIGW